MSLDFSNLLTPTKATEKSQYEATEHKVYSRLIREKQERQQSQEMFKRYQANIIKSDMLRCEINKDMLAGKDLRDILLKAIKCISLMTGDTIFYTANKEKIDENKVNRVI